MRKYGTRRSDAVCFKIASAAPLGPSRGSMGYWADLGYYQGEDSYFKLGRLLANGSITHAQHDEIRGVLEQDDAQHEGA